MSPKFLYEPHLFAAVVPRYLDVETFSDYLLRVLLHGVLEQSSQPITEEMLEDRFHFKNIYFEPLVSSNFVVHYHA
jgi:hypothetical protein